MYPIAMFIVGSSGLLLFFGLLIFILPLWIVPAILAFVALDRIPAEDRKQDPALALLLLIPFFSLIWAFFVYPRISASLESYFSRRGDRSNGDCGRSLALVFCICSLIPFVHIVALICIIIFFVKVFSLTGKIARVGPGPAPG
jgi:ABC-type Fe3+ transport system permease subunit